MCYVQVTLLGGCGVQFIRRDKNARKQSYKTDSVHYLTVGHYQLHALGLKLLIFKHSEKGHFKNCLLCQILPVVNITDISKDQLCIELSVLCNLVLRECIQKEQIV